MGKIKVLHIVPGFLYGGIESRLVDWYQCVNRELIQFDVLKVTPDQPNPLVKKIEELGGNVYSIPSLGIKSFRRHIKEVKRIINIKKYDVVHSHSLSYGYFPLVEAEAEGCPKRILHSRTTEYNPGDRAVHIKNALGKMAIKHATHFFACSEEAGVSAYGKEAEFEVIRNGIFLDKFAFEQKARFQIKKDLGIEESYVLGFVGRFSSPKNIPFLFEVFCGVHDQKKNLKLLIIGDDQENLGIKESAMKIAKEHNAEQDIIFAGRQENVYHWMNAMDIFLMPSLFEGFGTVAIEAQANGLPCIVSDNVPVSTKVSDTINYLPINDASIWVNLVLRQMDNKRLAGNIEMIREAGFDVNQTAKWLEEFYLS